MERFFIGQRVRILCHPALRGLEGCAARIVGRITEVRRRNQPIGIDNHWLVAPEGEDGSPPERTSRAFVVACTQLEPLQPEGMAPVAWSDCVWQPEQVLVYVEVPRRAAAPHALVRALAKRFGR